MARPNPDMRFVVVEFFAAMVNFGIAVVLSTNGDRLFSTIFGVIAVFLLLMAASESRP